MQIVLEVFLLLPLLLDLVLFALKNGLEALVLLFLLGDHVFAGLVLGNKLFSSFLVLHVLILHLFNYQKLLISEMFDFGTHQVLPRIEPFNSIMLGLQKPLIKLNQWSILRDHVTLVAHLVFSLILLRQLHFVD